MKINLLNDIFFPMLGDDTYFKQCMIATLMQLVMVWTYLILQGCLHPGANKL